MHDASQVTAQTLAEVFILCVNWTATRSFNDLMCFKNYKVKAHQKLQICDLGLIILSLSVHT